MIGAIIGAGLSIAGSVVGGIKAAQESRKAKKELDNSMRENQSWYDRTYNEDPTKRASANYLLTKTAEAVKDRNRNAKGTQAVMGGTEDSVTATKEANSQTLSDTAAKITAENDTRKDKIEDRYQDNKSAIRGGKMQYSLQNANNISSAVQGVAGAAGSIATAIDGDSQDKKYEKFLGEMMDQLNKNKNDNDR